MDPKNKGKTLTHVIRTWVKSKVFEDFYEWVTFIFDLVPDMNIDFVVKPHPNAKPLNERILKDIQLIYPKVRFLDDSISSVDIIKDGAEFMLTVYGTAVHEFAYQDITVLTAGDHPAAAYSFSVNSISKEEFKENLLNIRDINLQMPISSVIPSGGTDINSYNSYISEYFKNLENFNIKYNHEIIKIKLPKKLQKEILSKPIKLSKAKQQTNKLFA